MWGVGEGVGRGGILGKFTIDSNIGSMLIVRKSVEVCSKV